VDELRAGPDEPDYGDRPERQASAGAGDYGTVRQRAAPRSCGEYAAEPQERAGGGRMELSFRPGGDVLQRFQLRRLWDDLYGDEPIAGH